MEDKKININVEGTELVIREGKAPEIEVERAVSIEGNFETIAQYMEKRDFDHKKAHLVTNRKQLFARLVINPDSARKEAMITGEIKKNKEMDVFQINTSSALRINALRLLASRYKYIFKNNDNSKMIDFLKKVNVQRNIIMKNENDRKGNIDMQIKQTLDTDNILNKIQLCMPVFENGEKITFDVDIIIDCDDSGMMFYFESSELIVMEQEMIDKMFDELLERTPEDIVIAYN